MTSGSKWKGFRSVKEPGWGQGDCRDMAEGQRAQPPCLPLPSHRWQHKLGQMWASDLANAHTAGSGWSCQSPGMVSPHARRPSAPKGAVLVPAGILRHLHIPQSLSCAGVGPWDVGEVSGGRRMALGPPHTPTVLKPCK